MKKTYLLLGLILVLGFILRSYNLNFPSIGYHNCKENEYLSMADQMQRTRDFITRRVYFYNAFQENPTMRIYPQPPLVSYQTLISWKFLGENLWGPRLFNVLFGVLSILIIYLISELLFANIALSLFTSFLLAILPLAVFFSRNLQPESPGFFFILLGNLFYLRFVVSAKKDNLLWGGLFFSIAWLYKFSFLIGVLPCLFCFPFTKLLLLPKLKSSNDNGPHKCGPYRCVETNCRGAIYRARLINWRRKYGPYVLFLLPYSVMVMAILWLVYVGQWQFDPRETANRVSLFAIFKPAYWIKSGYWLWWFIKEENFTLIYTLLALAGIIVAFVKRQGLLNRYIMGWALAVIPYSMIFSDHINQHNYYQMPFLGLVCISCVYATLFISEAVKKFFKKDILIYLIIVIIGISLPSVYKSTSMLYGVVMPGVDVAGESIKEFTLPQERIFLFIHDHAFGIARYAQRYAGWAIEEFDLEDFKNKGEKFEIRYVCFYPLSLLELLRTKNPLFFNYIQDNYHLKEVGLSEEPRKFYYVILEKGYGLDLKNSLQSLSGKTQLRKIYHNLGKDISFYSFRPTEK